MKVSLNHPMMIIYIYFGLIKTVVNFKRIVMAVLPLSLVGFHPINFVLYIIVPYSNYVIKKKRTD